MHDVLNTGSRVPRDTATALGFHRVEEVRVIVGGGRAVAVVTGITHRYPHTCRVSLASAARLAREGVPLRMETSGRGRS